MTKKGPISEAEAFYIMNHLDMHPRAIGKKIGRSCEFVTSYIESHSKSKLSKEKSKVNSRRKREKEEKERQEAIKSKTTQIVSEESKDTLLSKQFGRRENGGTVVMTPNASIMADEKRKNFKGNNIKSHCVTTIKDNLNGQS